MGVTGEPDCYSLSQGRLLLRVKVHPGAARNRIDGARAGELVVRVAAPPEKGKANRELLRFLARRLGLPRAELEIRSGETSPHKLLSLPEAARGRLDALRGGEP